MRIGGFLRGDALFKLRQNGNDLQTEKDKRRHLAD